ncbi:MAG: hypothetical protein F4Y84_20280 [Caldilineaceae bacterium SB0665_bin_25]|nr:hypothetical protein [Caldilineaceae bacterium SB0665_bin_25]
MTDQTMTEQTKTETTRLAMIRRLYLYLIAFISLVAGLSAAYDLIEALLRLWITDDTFLGVSATDSVQRAIARPGGFLIVSAPIFLVHWRYISRLTLQPGESHAALRKLFIYAALATTTYVSARALYHIIEGSLQLLLGAAPTEEELRPGGWVAQFFHAGIHLPLSLFFARLLRGDGDLGVESGWAGSWRRLFQLLAGLVGLGLLLTGAADVLNFVWRAVLEPLGATSLATVGTGWWQRGISGSLAAFLVGGLVWRLNNLYWNALMTAQPPEGRMALRRLYLYVATVLAAAITLVPVAMLLRLGVLFLFGGVDTGDIDIDDLTTPLGLLPVGALAWRWHWLQVSAEAQRYGDTRESEFVRRLYYYAVAATGLLLLWIGLVDLVRALLDLAIIGSTSVEKGFRAHQFASGVSLIAVGAPVWSLHWRSAQRAAEQDNEAGRAERASWPRRVYLYGIAFVGALLILFELAQVVYRLLLWALGDPNADFFGAETLDGLVRAGAAAAFWAVHILAIRNDTRMVDEKAEAAARESEQKERRREELVTRIEELETELSALRAELAELEDEELSGGEDVSGDHVDAGS